MGRPKSTQTVEKEEQEFSSKDMLSDFLEENKDEHFAHIQPKSCIISTGSLLLNSLIKIRSGGVVRLLGKGAELGKTSESFVLADNYMKVMPKSKTLYLKAEARLSPEMQARTGMKFVFKAEDWDYGTVFVFPCNIFETFARMQEKFLSSMYENGEHLCTIVDSLDGLSLKNDLKKEVFGDNNENVKVAGVPLLTKLLFKRLGLAINSYDSLMIVTSQYTNDIKLDPYSPANVRQGEASGGNSIAHQSDYVLQYLPRFQGDWILEKPDEKPDAIKNKIIGVYATIEIKKSGTDVSGTKVKIPIKKGRVGCAIWREFEVCDMLLAWSMIQKGGAGWFTLTPETRKELLEVDSNVPEKIQGMNNIRLYLEENPKVTDYLFNKFENLIS